MRNRPDLLIFSDLDGTLLDHRSYSWHAARPALDCIKSINVGLILATSKTAAEVTPLREEIGFPHWPAIVENGSGLLDAGSGNKPDATAYQHVRDVLSKLPQGFLGFGDMSAADVSKHTGLSVEEAMRAKDRCFSEPGIWTGTDDAFTDFQMEATNAGLLIQQGGRFTTLSFGGTKADKVDELTCRFSPVQTLALGDAPNDFEMLRRADFGVFVTNPNKLLIWNDRPIGLRTTRRSGPEGWADAVFDVLNELSLVGETKRHG